jgi:hypothetical protein
VTAPAVLRELAERGVRVSAAGDRLRLSGPEDAVTDDLVQRVRQHKRAIVEALHELPLCSECAAPIPPNERETWWGVHRVHHACGLTAWRREWQGKLPATDEPIMEA